MHLQNQTSVTLQRIGVDLSSLNKERENEAVEAIQMLRLEPIIISEGETFDWSNVIAKPDLLECRDPSKQQNLFLFSNSFQEDEEWPVIINKKYSYQFAENSLFFFTKDSPFRISIIKLIETKKMKILIRLITIINIIAFCLYDYSVRIHHYHPIINRWSVGMEILCNIFFGAETAMEIIAQGFFLEKKSYLRSWWNIINFLTFISAWVVISDENSSQTIIQILRIIRLLRAIRFIQDIPLLKKSMNAFMQSFTRLGPILIPLLFVMLYYTIIGLHLFQGLTEKRCRMTPEPVDGEWPADLEIKFLCGIWECPEDRHCGSLADYNLPRDHKEGEFEELAYNFNRFDDFFYSLFVVFTFLNVTGWSGTTFMYWKAMTTYATAFYFVTLIFLLAYILSNLLLATFYESFMVQSSIKQGNNQAKQEEAQIENEIQKKRQQQMMGRLAALNENKTTHKKKSMQFKMSLYFTEQDRQSVSFSDQAQKFQRLTKQLYNSVYFTYVNGFVIILSTIIICADHYGISKYQLKQLYAVDFFCIWYFLFELFITFWGKGLKHFQKIVYRFDALVILSQLFLIIYLYSSDQPLIYNYNPYINMAKTLKILRFIKLLWAAKIFYTISIITRCAIFTLISVSDILVLWVFLVIIFALFGQELLAYKARFEVMEGEISELNLHGEPPVIHYETFGNAILASLNIFYNEEWHISMFQIARGTSLSIVFYVFAILIGQVLFIRLFLAIFLNYFGKQLNLVEQQVKPVQYNQAITNFFQNCRNFFNKKQKQNQIHSLDENEENQKLKNVQRKIRQSILQELKLGADKQGKNQNKIEQPIASNIVSQKESMIDKHIPYDNVQEEGKGLNEDKQIVDLDVQEEDTPPHKEDANNVQSPQDQQNEGIHRQKNVLKSDKTLFIFPPESSLRVYVTKLVTTQFFRIFNFILIVLTAIRIAILMPLTDPKSDLYYALQISYIFITVFYVLVILLNCIAFGLYSKHNSYFRQSVYNIFAFIITIIELLTLIFNFETPLSEFITSLRILQFIQIGATYSKDISYAQTALLNAFAKMLQLCIFSFFILMIFGSFGMKLLKGTFFNCRGLPPEIEVNTNIECMDNGGAWVNSILGFDNIIESICLLFAVATTEGWIPLYICQLENAWSAVGEGKQPVENYNRYWAIYFTVFFFFGNLCLLNMFIGLIVNTYQEAKLKAQNLHLLDETQREWFQIKQSIYKMKPIVKSKKPKNTLRKIAFFMVKDSRFKVFWLVIIFLNTLILSIYFHRSPKQYKQVLDIFNAIFVGIFTFEILCRFLAKSFSMYMKDLPNVIDIIGLVPCLVNLFIRNEEGNFFFLHVFNAICISFQLARNYKIIKRFNNLEKLFSSIFSVIPSALSMMYIMFIYLFIYTNLGMDLFAYLRPQKNMNGFDLHFRKFTTAMFSLVRVASSEQWWYLLVDSAHTRQPDFACIYISNYDEFVEHGFNGCGTKIAYIYYISFHLIFSLMILNLFIASILTAYEEHVKQEESAISKYQLNDVLKLWLKYDGKGAGYINYKDFWKLSSEIAIIFGVDQSDLLDVNNKKNFLKVLNIPIFENKGSNLLCYKFHDVIISLTKISVTLKYGATNLEPTEPEILAKVNEILTSNMPKNSEDFRPTQFNSGDMVAIITIQKKFRIWKRRALSKDGNVMNEFSDIKNLIKQQKKLEEEQEQDQ